jgi:predicted  nucleic acid-binding Zn-ribbon protein
MRKISLLFAITCFSAMSFAQPSTELNNERGDSAVKEIMMPQERIIKLEKEIEALKASHAELHKQFAEIKNRLPVVKKKKLVASRVGSKQGVWVEE